MPKQQQPSHQQKSTSYEGYDPLENQNFSNLRETRYIGNRTGKYFNPNKLKEDSDGFLNFEETESEVQSQEILKKINKKLGLINNSSSSSQQVENQEKMKNKFYQRKNNNFQEGNKIIKTKVQPSLNNLSPAKAITSIGGRYSLNFSFSMEQTSLENQQTAESNVQVSRKSIFIRGQQKQKKNNTQKQGKSQQVQKWQPSLKLDHLPSRFEESSQKSQVDSLSSIKMRQKSNDSQCAQVGSILNELQSDNFTTNQLNKARLQNKSSKTNFYETDEVDLDDPRRSKDKQEKPNEQNQKDRRSRGEKKKKNKRKSNLEPVYCQNTSREKYQTSNNQILTESLKKSSEEYYRQQQRMMQKEFRQQKEKTKNQEKKLQQEINFKRKRQHLSLQLDDVILQKPNKSKVSEQKRKGNKKRQLQKVLKRLPNSQQKKRQRDLVESQQQIHFSQYEKLQVDKEHTVQREEKRKKDQFNRKLKQNDRKLKRKQRPQRVKQQKVEKERKSQQKQKKKKQGKQLRKKKTKRELNGLIGPAEAQMLQNQQGSPDEGRRSYPKRNRVHTLQFYNCQKAVYGKNGLLADVRSDQLIRMIGFVDRVFEGDLMVEPTKQHRRGNCTQIVHLNPKQAMDFHGFGEEFEELEIQYKEKTKNNKPGNPVEVYQDGQLFTELPVIILANTGNFMIQNTGRTKIELVLNLQKNTDD